MATDSKRSKMLTTSKSRTSAVTVENLRANKSQADVHVMLADERGTHTDTDKGNVKVTRLSSKSKQDTSETDSRMSKNKDAAVAKSRRKEPKAVKC